jgi:hypothetical protein
LKAKVAHLNVHIYYEALEKKDEPSSSINVVSAEWINVV